MCIAKRHFLKMTSKGISYVSTHLTTWTTSLQEVQAIWHYILTIIIKLLGQQY